MTFAADADARVEQDNPTSNYGSSGTLRIEASDPGDDEAIESYVRFTVAGLQGPVQQAKLRLYATTNGTSVGSEVYSVTGSWTESGIIWNTRPHEPFRRTRFLTPGKASNSSSCPLAAPRTSARPAPWQALSNALGFAQPA